MKKQQLTLFVPKPCHEVWDKMTPNERGRHCASCNKTVIDFSNYTDKALVEFFKKNKGSGCGNFTVHQLNRPLEAIEPTRRSLFYKLLYGTALASWLGISVTANAQTNTPQVVTEQKNAQSSKKDTSNIGCHEVQTVSQSEAINYTSSQLNIRGGYSSATVYIVDGKKTPTPISNTSDIYTLPEVSELHTRAEFEGTTKQSKK